MPAGRAHKEEKKMFTPSVPIPRKAEPEDLSKIGVQKTGLAMGAAEAIKKNSLAMEKALKETE
jgi:hypothetical protein